MTSTEQNELLDFLAEVPFFSEVERASLLELYKNSELEQYIANNRIIEKGDVGDAMYVILDGKVKVHDKDHSYGTLSKGDCVGEYALIDEEPRSVSVTALEDTSVLKIPTTHFSQLMDSDKGFVKGVMSVLIKRHRELDIIQEQLASSKKEVELANSKMAGLIDGAMDAIIMFDGNFRILLANDSAKTILENSEVTQRNILFFLDDDGADMLEDLVKSKQSGFQQNKNAYLPKIIKVIGSDGTETLHEGTLSCYGDEKEVFYTLILRNIDDRLTAEHKISSLETQTEYLQEEIKELTNDHGIIAQHKSMKKVLDLISQVAQTEATVLIHGETGTGKELVARAIHAASNRSKGPLIRINCGAIPANLIESELFGHEKGAFTGATSSRKGRFLLADKGTIFLDEIGELPLDLQPKLLRVIQEGEFDPVGSSTTQKVDVRIIAASHRDLLQFSKEGKFREDLYYRLNVFPIEIPALRDRGNDVSLIADAMVEHFSTKLNRKIKKLTQEQKKLFQEYAWPGNVRELQNLVERAVIVSQNGEIDWSFIIPNTNPRIAEGQTVEPDHILTAQEMTQLEKGNILKALKQTRWKISGEKGAAALLGVPPTTLTSKIKALGIVRPV
ncbi:sigma 54-interacting transcriptional regulator [Muricauda sp. CAU 1633]|uniref:sigma 54-interacting transcriptional regulator n=1 Tax=Allomuricauda sp. CAU 1633 TaxID=2816036 RepID=UPI001A8C5C2D|nr:sigma 54-interacting transcriptional regulator [Muricauda sp. CAU 1633]MBO0322335.1 sigma 54-interacting transcriptional regulator [Muricauda sp. CAU 1633]